MPGNNLALDSAELREWRSKIEITNRNNIFCHCRTCDAEWIDSSFEAVCSYGSSTDVEYISCWQFSDE